MLSHISLLAVSQPTGRLQSSRSITVQHNSYTATHTVYCENTVLFLRAIIYTSYPSILSEYYLYKWSWIHTNLHVFIINTAYLTGCVFCIDKQQTKQRSAQSNVGLCVNPAHLSHNKEELRVQIYSARQAQILRV